MDLFAKFILLLLPTQKIRPRWKDSWAQREKLAFLIQVRIVHVLAALTYLAHLCFIDSVYRLEPRKDWVILRSIGISVNLVGLLLSFVFDNYGGTVLRLPMMVTGFVCAYIQGVSMLWFSGTPYIFAIITPALATLSLRLSIVTSGIYMLVCYACEFNAWLARPTELATILSAATMGLLFVMMLRSRLGTDVAAFISDQQNLESQKKLIEAEIELNQQIKAFLPKEIYERFLFHVKKEGLAPSVAMFEVLRLRHGLTACLYTDIRGFTQKTKTVPTFIENNAVPNIRACTDIIEKQHGIPKLVGDLVFAYFDSQVQHNIGQALLSALQLDQLNTRLNEAINPEDRIKRYILLSLGEAVVGNVGGTESALDITVLGNPANIVSRIDPLTKDSKIKTLMDIDRIIMTEEAALHLLKILPGLNYRIINLAAIDIRIKDFEEEKEIFVVPTTDGNFKQVSELITRSEANQSASTKSSIPQERRAISP